jgi:hypothetical protein
MWFDGLLVMTLSFFTVLYTPVKAKTEDELQAEEDQRILAELYGDQQEGDESDEEMKQAWDKIRNLGPGSGSSSENGADPASPAIPPEDRGRRSRAKPSTKRSQRIARLTRRPECRRSVGWPSPNSSGGALATFPIVGASPIKRH